MIDERIIIDATPATLPKEIKNLDRDVDIFGNQTNFKEGLGIFMKQVVPHLVKGYTEFQIPIPETIEDCKTSIDFRLFDMYSVMKSTLEKLAEENGKDVTISPITYKLIDK